MVLFCRTFLFGVVAGFKLFTAVCEDDLMTHPNPNPQSKLEPLAEVAFASLDDLSMDIIVNAVMPAGERYELIKHILLAIAPRIQEMVAAERERCIAAVRSERLTDPDFKTSDEAYQRALDDAERAIRGGDHA